MSSTGKLAGKVALVTGGSRGLGRGIAEGFAAEGANVVVNYLKDEKAANAVVDAIKKHGADAIAIRANIGDVDDVTRMVEATVKKFGTIDILVNNAGMLNSCKLADMSVETWGRHDPSASARHVPVHAFTIRTCSSRRAARSST